MQASIFRASGWARRFTAVLLAAVSLAAPAQTRTGSLGPEAIAEAKARAEAQSQAQLQNRNWEVLAKDGIHDPRGPAIKDKQNPGEALSKLTPDVTGNMVRWIQALEKGEINPRASLNPGTKIQVYTSDVLLNLQGGMSIVKFPHRQHTEWLDCSNCHPHLFKEEIGATKISMLDILNGEQCGVCHGAVSFPLTECFRCHNTSRAGQGSSPMLPQSSPGGSKAKSR